MSESTRMKKAVEITRKLINEENTVDAMTIITMAAGLVFRALTDPEDFDRTADLYSRLIKMAPHKLPDISGSGTEIAH